MNVSTRMALVASLIVAFSVSAQAATPKHYPTEEAAAKACKSGVVWANTDTGVFHAKGSRWYGTTKDGAWVCRAAAERAGMKAAKNE